VGRLVEDPEMEELSYLVLELGHLWGKKEVSLPVSAILKMRM
jgi:hypothetical protein